MPDASDPSSALQSLIDRYLRSYAVHDATGCASTYCDDGQILSPFGLPAIGRPAIAAVHRDWFAEEETNKVMTIADWGAEGDLGWCLITYAADVMGLMATDRLKRGNP